MLEYLETLSDCKSLDEVWHLHCAAMENYGFDRLAYGFTRFRTENSLGPHADLVMLTSHPSEYVHKFIESGLFRFAPMTQWANKNSGACSWSWVTSLLALEVRLM